MTLFPLPFAWRRAGAALLALGLALACATPGPPALEARETGQLVFWEVRGADGARAWLMGSVHFGSGDHAYDPAIQSAFAEADTVVMEVTPEEMDPTAMVLVLLERGLLPDGQTLDQVLEPETYERLQKSLAAQGLPAAGYMRMKPWVLVLTLAAQQFAAQGYQPEAGVDHHFQVRAQVDAKPVVGLERVDDQIDAFDAMSPRAQEQALAGVLEAEEGDLSLETLLDAWSKGDLDTLQAIVFQDLGEDPDLDAMYETLYFARNRRMSDGVAELMEPGDDLFVVIGAGHMLGEEGVPALLAERGFQVRRVPKTP